MNDPADAVQRAKDAQRILAEPLMKEAFDLVERGVVRDLLAPDLTPEQLDAIHRNALAAGRFRQVFTDIITAGKSQEAIFRRLKEVA